MSRIRHVAAESAVAPNLVPMVDVMFLLLLFLMLGADMGQRELEDVRLPVARTVQEDDPVRDLGDVAGRLVLNVYHPAAGCAAHGLGAPCGERTHWVVAARGSDFGPGDDAALRALLRERVERDRAARGEPPRSRNSPSQARVLVRADQLALYECVQRALNACADEGIFKIELGAVRSDE